LWVSKTQERGLLLKHRAFWAIARDQKAVLRFYRRLGPRRQQIGEPLFRRKPASVKYGARRGRECSRNSRVFDEIRLHEKRSFGKPPLTNLERACSLITTKHRPYGAMSRGAD